MQDKSFTLHQFAKHSSYTLHFHMLLVSQDVNQVCSNGQCVSKSG